jgi:hypothetical protein
MLENYIVSAQDSPDRFRNIAIMVAFINSKQKQTKKSTTIKRLLALPQELSGVQERYRDYVVRNTAAW